MDPILGATQAVPLEPARQPTGPTPATRTDATDGTAASAPADGGLTDAELQQYKDVAAAFVGQMYMKLWRDAQRNSG